MQKGEGRDYSGDPHKVDGLSGATITANGVNNMLKNYLQHYSAYMSSQKSGEQSEGVASN
jgi:Na+-transporting NADH:ubiquinone oxidoreductase subunit C